MQIQKLYLNCILNETSTFHQFPNANIFNFSAIVLLQLNRWLIMQPLLAIDDHIIYYY